MASDERQVSDKDLRRIMGRQPDERTHTEALLDELEQGLGLLSTLAPNVEMDGVRPLKMAREIHAAISEKIDGLEARIDNLELSNANLRDTIALGTMSRMRAPFKERLTEAWRVVRGVVDVATMRRGYYDQASRADREMMAHSATLQRVEEENKATGAEMHRLREERRKTMYALQDLQALVDRPTTQRSLTMIPSVGRDVHYVAFGTPGGEYQEGAHRAAKITDVHHGTGKPGAPNNVSLVIFNPTGLHFRADVPYDAAGTLPGTWHEPERV